MDPKDQYLTKIQVLGKIGPFLGQNSNFCGRNQKFWYQHSGKAPQHLVCIVFWSGMRPNGPKMTCLGQKSIFWRERVKPLAPSHQGTNWDTSFVLKTLTGEAPIGQLGRTCTILTRKFGYLGPKVNFSFGKRNFCQQDISPVYPGLQLFHPYHPPKNSMFRGSPLFLAIFGLCHFTIISTLNFGPWSTKLVGPSGPQWQRTWSRPELGKNGRFYIWPKIFFVQKSIFFQKNTRNLLKDWYLFGKRVLFCLHNFSRSWPEHS